MKADPKELYALADAVRWCLKGHSSAIRANPDIASDIVKVRDKVLARYDKVTEQPHEIDDTSHSI